MRFSLRFLFIAALGFFVSSVQAAEKSKSIRALLVTGGCCHNYKYQSKALITGVAKEAKVDWKVVNEGGTGTRAQIALYDNPNWAKGFDVVVHNECFASTADEAYIAAGAPPGAVVGGLRPLQGHAAEGDRGPRVEGRHQRHRGAR